MEEDLESFGKALNVEVHVDAGGISTVSYTAIVHLEDYTDRPASLAKLTAVTDLLRSALPMATLKSEETDFKAREIRPALNPDGTPVTREQIIRDGQEAIKAVLLEKPKPKG